MKYGILPSEVRSMTESVSRVNMARGGLTDYRHEIPRNRRQSPRKQDSPFMKKTSRMTNEHERARLHYIVPLVFSP
jgi:hypothetical protein